ncbi:hypothetical protein E2562_011656 [Oryza meyeriana var. granulata]|uniref:Uncharacterized protein n=1 Tax=Oryza meyeriana var. granulata TaxID=110450 RepID=A0A6G1DGR2_9ORYZ|nr:hypothetical protein E2562_011656 [Oryza meyeriana var. granulata]
MELMLLSQRRLVLLGEVGQLVDMAVMNDTPPTMMTNPLPMVEHNVSAATIDQLTMNRLAVQSIQTLKT